MKIINTDIQARAVLQLVTATALFIAGLFIFAYRLLEPTQQLLYHSISSSFQVFMWALGASVLLRSYRREHAAYQILASGLAGVAGIALIDGILGSYFDTFSAQIPAWIYLAFLPLVISQMVIFAEAPKRKAWQQEFVRLCGSYALGLSALSLVMLLTHLFLKAPILAKHPTGSLVVAVVGMLAGVAVYAANYRGRRPLPKLSRTSTNFATVAILGVIIFGLGMFHTQMSDLKKEGQRSVELLREGRIAIGEIMVETFTRLGQRWEAYPYEHHNELMEVDVNAYLQQIDYLEALLLVSPSRGVIFERVKPSRPSYFTDIVADPVVKEALQSNRENYEILVPLFGLESLSAKVVMRVPVNFQPRGQSPTASTEQFSMLAVLDVRVLLGSALLNRSDSDIETFTEVKTDAWMDRSGFWLTEETESYIADTAILLYESTMDLYYADGVPTQAYLFRLEKLQETSNLQMLIVVGGIGLVLLVVLAVERNVSLEVQGKQLFYQAHHDALTGLWNRTSIENYIGRHFTESRDITVMFIDLDGFTMINDSLGLHVGDEILNQLAERLQAKQPRRSELARFASDEFILVMHGATILPDRILALASDIMSTVAQPYNVESHKVYLTASIGVAHQTRDVRTPLELIQRADMAMHLAKKQGYNHVLEYDEGMALKTLANTSMRSQLQEAIEQNQLQLYFQPIVRSNDQQTVQVEALLRWPQADGSFIPPDQFIPLAESTGQIVPLSEWVLRKACEAAVGLQRHNPALRMSINVSALHFNRANFVDFVIHTLAETGCRGAWIELELTESILLEGTSYAIDRLQALRKHGISIALDDFGTGFSSLSHLKRLPIDVVKIDRSFIAGIQQHRSDRVLVESVIKIAQSLNFAVLAEGVETAEQAQFVTDLGCNFMQGYYFGHPAPLETL